MPTTAQIENAEPLTQDQADDLVPAIRGSALYSYNRALYPDDLAELLGAYVGVDSRASKLLSAIRDVVFNAGYSDIALKGGKDGVELSTAEDREKELALALDTLVDRPIGAVLGGINQAAFGSANLTNRAVW